MSISQETWQNQLPLNNMKIVTKEVKIKKTTKLQQIEDNLSFYGEPLRYAIVNTDDDYFYIEGSFIME